MSRLIQNPATIEDSSDDDEEGLSASAFATLDHAKKKYDVSVLCSIPFIHPSFLSKLSPLSLLRIKLNIERALEARVKSAEFEKKTMDIISKEVMDFIGDRKKHEKDNSPIVNEEWSKKEKFTANLHKGIDEFVARQRALVAARKLKFEQAKKAKEDRKETEEELDKLPVTLVVGKKRMREQQQELAHKDEPVANDAKKKPRKRGQTRLSKRKRVRL